MTIGRMQMNRQLYSSGSKFLSENGRDRFGLGSFIRKIIPNEISKVATTIAPFIASFDPITAAALQGIGSYDQTGKFGDSLKSAALTYGGGQLGRFIGGAGFQSLPGTSGFAGQSLLSPASYSGGIMNALNPLSNTGLTSPIGSGSAVGEYLQGQGVPRVEGIGIDPGASGTYVDGVFQPSTDSLSNLASQNASDAITSLSKDLTEGKITTSEALTKLNEIKQGIPGGTNVLPTEGYIDLGKKALSGDTDAMLQIAKNVGNDIFYKIDPKTGKPVLDKQATMAIILMSKSYLEAKDEDPTITKSTYDEVKKAAKKSEYQEATSNFFTKRADGGRIGYASGSEDPKFDPSNPKYKGINKKVVLEFIKEGIPLGYDSPEEYYEDFYNPIGMKNGGMSSQMAMAADMIKKGMDDDTISSITQLTVDQIKQIKQSMTQPQQKANGGRMGYETGTTPPISGEEFKKLLEEFMKNKEKQDEMARNKKAKGGRMGYEDAGIVSLTDQDSGVIYRDPKTGEPIIIDEFLRRTAEDEADIQLLRDGEEPGSQFISRPDDEAPSIINKARGGSIKGKGIKSIPVRLNGKGVKELDFRPHGGFVPVGVKERADDVPAMLSKNEFVFTAKAVRNAGNGDVNKGAKKMYALMKQLENKKVKRA